MISPPLWLNRLRRFWIPILSWRHWGWVSLPWMLDPQNRGHEEGIGWQGRISWLSQNGYSCQFEEPGLYSEGNEESQMVLRGFDLLCYVLQTFNQHMIVELCHRRGFILGIKLLQKGQYLCPHWVYSLVYGVIQMRLVFSWNSVWNTRKNKWEAQLKK